MCAVVACGCPGTKHIDRPYPPPPPEDVIKHLESIRERAQNLNAETKSDVRLQGQRYNVTVDILAAWGGKLRFLAINPNDSTAADLASDGETFCFIDSNNNCGGCGPATPENVGQLIHIVLPPDAIVAVLLGSTPLITTANPTVTWDASLGAELVELHDGQLTQRIVSAGLASGG